MKPAIKLLAMLAGLAVIGAGADAWAQSVGQEVPSRCHLTRSDDPECQRYFENDGVARVYEEYGQKLRDNEKVTPLASDVFGESTSLYSGATEFRVVDIDIPGNSSLPFQLARRIKVASKKTYESLGGFGSWEIDVPYIVGTFDSVNRWNTDQNGNTQRCDQPWYPAALSGFEATDFWSGTQVYIPGQGERELLRIDENAPPPRPSTAYKWTTRGDFRLRCLSSTTNGYPGQGFVGVDGEGNEYYFTIGLERSDGFVRKNRPPLASVTIARTRVYLMASEVRDRHGNWVRYHYSGVGPGAYLTQISASDGRSIGLAYEQAEGYTRIASAHAHGKSWQYIYRETAGLGARGTHPLSQVVRPDGSKWLYTYTGNLFPTHFDNEGAAHCPVSLGDPSDFRMIITHPAGAVGDFLFTYQNHYKSGVPTTFCSQNQDGVWELNVPYYFSSYSLVSKSIDDRVTPQMTWNYAYGQPGSNYPFHGSTPPCLDDAACPPAKTVAVTQPDSTRIEHEFGIRYFWNETRLLGTRHKSVTGEVIKTETSVYVTDQEAATMPFPNRVGILGASQDFTMDLNRPVRQTSIVQQGVTFQSTTEQFDAFVRPLRVARSSTLGYARTDSTRYHDNYPKWVVGQVEATWDSSSCLAPCSNPSGTQLTSQTVFDPVTALPGQRFAFGKLQENRTYHSSPGQVGLLHEIYDPSGFKRTRLLDYYRGIL